MVELRRCRAAVISSALLLTLGCGADGSVDTVASALDGILAASAESAGEVQVKRAAEAYWEAAGIATVFRPGDWVRTGPAGFARLEFLGGGRLELGEGALIVVDALEEQGEPGSETRRAPLVAVEAGSVRGVLRRMGSKAQPLLIRTADGAQARLEARRDEEVEFRLAKSERGTGLMVSRGEVTLAAEGGERVLAAGRAVDLGRGGVQEYELPGLPRSLNPAPDARLLFRPGASTRLTWAPVPNAVRYEVQIAPDMAFRTLLQTVEVPLTRFDLAPEKAGLYAWRVAARDAAGRQGEFGFARRIFFETDEPRDLVRNPPDGAVFGHVGTPLGIAFGWKAAGTGAVYRLVVARTANLLDTPIVDELVSETEVVIDTLAPGRYAWGVFLANGATEDQPLFVKPRRLAIKKVGADGLRAPKAIRTWGE